MYLTFSASEKHPCKQKVVWIPSPSNTKPDKDKNCFGIFGLNKKRGDNAIYASRINDAFCKFVKDFHLDLIPPKELPYMQENVQRMEQMGINFTAIGISYSQRKKMSAIEYLEFIKLAGSCFIEAPLLTDCNCEASKKMQLDFCIACGKKIERPG